MASSLEKPRAWIGRKDRFGAHFHTEARSGTTVDNRQPDSGAPQRRADDRSHNARATDGGMTKRAQMALSVRAAFWLNFALVLGAYYAHHGLSPLTTGNGVSLLIARVSGLVASYFILVQLLVIGRNPWLGRLFGHDQLSRFRTRLERFTFALVVVHAATMTWAYAGSSIRRLPDGITALLMHTPYVLSAFFGFLCLCAVVGMSISITHKKLRYQTWRFVRVSTFLGIVLALPHQMFLGSDFVHRPLTQLHWLFMYLACVGSLLIYRVYAPIYNALRYRMRVSHVVREGSKTFSIYITGHNLGDLRAQSGQFFIWRFLDRENWSEAHPYSLSAAPNGKFLRITVKAVGDGTSALRYVQPGTRVTAEGPYGAFTADSRTRRKVVLIGAGIGITPIRALAETFPARRGDITVMYRASTAKDVVFAQEFEEIAQERNIRVQIITGGRTTFNEQNGPFSPRHFLQATPDVTDSDVYICGPRELATEIACSLRSLGLSQQQIHCEAFTL